MAYGFALLVWEPLTHLVVVPTIIRSRRSGRGGIARQVARHGSKANLTMFLLLVLVLGTAPLGVMTFEFQVPAGGGGGADVDTVELRDEDGDTIPRYIRRVDLIPGDSQ